MNLLRRKWPFFGEPAGAASSPPTFRAWGKLPLFGDYQGWPSEGTFSEIAERYTHWIRQGWETVRGIMGAPTIVTHRVWCRWPEDPQVLFASIWHSCDSVPQPMARSFPFTCFITETDLTTDWEQRITRIGQAWDCLEAVRRQLGLISDRTLFEQICQQGEERVSAYASAAGTEASLDSSTEISLRAFGRGILGTLDEQQIRAWFAETTQLLLECRGQAATKQQLAIACPVAAELPLCTQVLAWVRWLSVAIPEEQPHLIVAPEKAAQPPGSDVSRIFICLRQLTDVDLLLLTTHVHEYACVKWITVETTPLSGDELIGSGLDLDLPLLTWLKTLECKA